MKRFQHTSFLSANFLIFFAFLSIQLKTNKNVDPHRRATAPAAQMAMTCEEPIIESLTSSTDSICSGDRVFLRVSGSLNDAENWFWYTEGCGQGDPIAVGSFITVTPDTTTTYYMRGESECWPDGLECMTIKVTVIDSIAPEISCIGDQIAQVDANCEFVLPDYRVLVVATDNCVEEPLIEQVPAPNTVVSENTDIKLIAWDKNNNSDTCSFRLLLTDPFPPVMNCQDATIYLTEETNLAYLEPRMIDGGAYDACGDIKLRIDKTTFDCTQLGEHTVTLTAEDRVGNILTCEATVTVKDTISPEAVCKDVEVFLNAQGTAALSAEEVNDGSSSNCTIDLLEISKQNFTCADLGQEQIILTVTDNSGNQSSCAATVTVKDRIAPTVSGQNISVQLDEQGAVSITPADINNGTADNCSLDTLWLSQYDFDCTHLGENTVTLFAKDVAGNENQSDFTVTVSDPISPVLSCGGDRNIALVEGCSFELPDYTLEATLTDNCGGAAFIDQSPAAGTSITEDTEVTIRAKDAAGNEVSCTFMVKIEDAAAPAINCPPAQTTALNSDCVGIVGDYASLLEINDNCGTEGLTLTQMPAPGASITDDTAVKFLVADAAGNEAECTFSLILTDDQAPEMECPADQLVVIEDGCSAAVPDFTPLVTLAGGCTEGVQLTQSPQAGTLVSEDTEITISAVDANGNEAVCTFTLRLEDNIKPSLDCEDDIFISIGENDLAELTSDLYTGLADDNCALESVDVNKRFFDCSDVGLNQVTLTAIDTYGNESTCTLTVGVLGSEACPLPGIGNSEEGMDMTGTPEETKIGDPCSCMGSGRFSEEVVIGPAKSGQSWEVAQTTLRAIENEELIPAGTPFIEIPYRNDSSLYVLTGIHLDGEGYELSASSPYYPGRVLGISNLCYYPNPEIINLDDSYCSNSEPITLEGRVGSNVQGTGTFRVDGAATETFDPSALGAGPHLVEFRWDAGNPAGELSPENVGCIESVTKTVMVSSSTPNFSCTGLVRVNANENCEALVTPDMIINGGFSCTDDYVVRIYKPGEGGYIDNPIPPEYYDQTLNVIVEHLPSGEYCEGQLIMEDKTPPVIECPEQVFEFTCTDYDSIFNRAEIFEEIGFDPMVDIYDACQDRSDVTVNWTDEFFPSNDECENFGRIVRTIDAVDANGNIAERCEITFLLKTPELNTDLIQKPFDWDICGEKELPTDDEGRPDPRISGAPYFINGFGDTVFVVNQSVCNLAVAYSDRVVEKCGSSFEIFRTWTYADPCTGQPAQEFIQTLRIIDKTAPVVSVPEDTKLEFSTGPFDCTSAFRVPEPVIEDCNTTTYTVEIRTVVPAEDRFGVPIPGEFDTVVINSTITGNSSNGYFASNVPVGEHYLLYKAVDDCGNNSEVLWVPFIVKDKVAPVAICGDDINFSIGGNGVGQLLVDDVNQGSRDNCGIVNLSMRREIDEVCLNGYVTDVIGRQIEGELTLEDLDKEGDKYYFNDKLVITFEEGKYYSSYEKQLYFFCCDVGTNVNVQLLVSDDSGNTNFCWINIAVEDKVPPLVTPPQGVTVDCDTLTFGITDLSDTLQLQQKFGKATASDNCDAVTFELPPQINLDDCGVGQIIRKFRARDASGNVSGIAQQVIEVIAHNNYEIRFPEDAVSAQCGMFEADTLEYQLFACDKLLVSVEDARFSPSGDECYKILRTYQIINDCEHDGIAEPITIGRDEDGDGVPGEEIYLLRRRNKIYLDNNNDETDGFIKEISSVGFWKYTQIINVYDSDDPVIDFTEPEVFCSYGNTNTGCETTVDIDFGVSDGCSPNELRVEVFLDLFGDPANRVEKTGTPEVRKENGRYIFEGDVPIGAHRLFVRLTDACGNQSTALIPFEVVDCKVASPICKGITAEIMAMDTDGDAIPDTGMAVVPATAALTSLDTLSDCSGPLTFSIHRMNETTIDPNQKELIFTCEDSLDTAIPVLIYVWDQADNPRAVQPDGTVGGPNYSVCETFVILQDNQFGVCAEQMLTTIDGSILTEDDQAIEGVMVQLSGNYSDSITTDIDGWYAFDELETNYDYSVRPELNHDYKNGVSTIDMVLISKHILGTESLASPYRMIAADINNSGSVTTFDLIQMRKLILALQSEFTNNSSWRFVDAEQEFPNPSNPWLAPLKEVINFNNIQNETLTANFIGIKIGDVNLNARTNSLIHTPRAEGGTFRIATLDRSFSPGEEIELTFTSTMLKDVLGYQFTLEFDPAILAIADIEYGQARKGDFGFKYVDEGLITTSWYPPQAGAEEDMPLFTLRFKARHYGQISESVRVSSRLTEAEAYNHAMQIMNVALDFDNAPATQPAQVFSLQQNRPNPFNDLTTIGFTLPKPGNIRLSIFDAGGRTLRSIEGYYDAGAHTVELNSSGLPRGVLYYRLESGNNMAIKKMILIE